jgi:hypothetical protein
MNAILRFYGPLNDFLPSERRGRAFSYPFFVPGSVKDMIEAAGVPHPEVDLILVNGASADFSYIVRDCDRIAVYPAFHSIMVGSLLQLRPQPERFCFVLDTHLGVLAGYLRMLGFDAFYRNDYNDEELAGIASRENRLLLTRDGELLKRREVLYGYFVRQTAPRQQLQEVVQRYSLGPLVKPFLRCIRCNGLLRKIRKESVRDRLPERTATYFEAFTICDSCGRIYWEGSHFQRMKRFLAETLRSA